MASQILDVAAATPYDVNPFTLMMSSAFTLVVVAISSRSASVNGRTFNSGVPCTVAVDQATYKQFNTDFKILELTAAIKHVLTH